MAPLSLPSVRSLLTSILATTLLLPAPASAASSTGCGKALPSGQKAGGNSVALSLKTDDGLTRTYRLYLPKLYTTSNPSPLIINYHGRGSNGAQQEQMTDMSDPAMNNASIVIYPDGVNSEWEGDPSSSGVDDVAFTHKLVDTTLAQYCVDTSRLYAVGASNGGGFVGNFLACDDWGANTFAVFGAAYGAFYTNTSDTTCGSTVNKVLIDSTNVPIYCNNTKQNVPMIEFHGTGDTTIPYTGGDRRGLCLPTIPHWVTQWATRTGLAATNTSQSLFKSKAFMFQFGSGSTLGQVTHYEVINMGHTWPTTAGGVAPFNATPIMLDFLYKWGPGDGKSVTTGGSSPTTTGSASATSTKKSAATSLSLSILSPIQATVLVLMVAVAMIALP